MNNMDSRKTPTAGQTDAQPAKFFKKRRRGTRAGVQCKLRQRGFKTLVPSLSLVNVRSLADKMDVLQRLKVNRSFRFSAALCFTDTGLSKDIPDSSVQLEGFRLLRADPKGPCERTRGGGLCFYVNEGWCTDVRVLKKTSSPHLETFFIDCRPLYLPWEFSSFVLVGVYIPAEACASEALQHLAEQVTDVERRRPGSPLIILGDFNGANFSHELPKYRQHISADENTPSHCYTALDGAYRSKVRSDLEISDQSVVHLLPTYQRKFRTRKPPVVQTVKRWTTESQLKLQACLDCTDWSVFEAAAEDPEELSDTVASYISFCEDLCLSVKTIRI